MRPLQISQFVVTLLVLVLLTSPAVAEGAKDWPLWSGPDGDLTSLDNGLFPDGDFHLVVDWHQPVGSAYAGMVVADDRLVTGSAEGESDFIVALHAETGDELWRYEIGPIYKGHDGSDDGLVGTPAIYGDVVYALGAWGHLAALGLEDGKPLWTLKLDDDLAGRKPEYGFSATPLLVDGVLVVKSGGEAGQSIHGLNPDTGERLWSTGDDMVGHQSPGLLEIDGRTHVLAITDKTILGLDPKSGNELWRQPYRDYDSNGSAHPIAMGDGKILLDDYRDVALLHIQHSDAGWTVDESWRSNKIGKTWGFAAPYEGHVYGFAGSVLNCLDATTGELKWKSRPPGGGLLILADGHLVVLNKEGEVVIVEATPEAYTERTRVKVLEKGYLSPLAFAGGHIFVRNLTEIAAVSVVAGAAPVVEETPATETAPTSAVR